jgi:hypothetical protein
VTPGTFEATRSSPSDPSAERDARRKERADRRGPRLDRPEQRKPPGTRPPLLTCVAGAGIVAIAVAIAALMGSQGSPGWLIGLVVSVVTFALVSALRRRHAA